jgi:hypothetical protein
VGTNTSIALDSTVEYYVFASEGDYQNALRTGNTSNSLFSGVYSNGEIQIAPLTSDKEYFVLVRFYDTHTFPGYSILYTNEESTYRIPIGRNAVLLKGSVQLRAQEGLVTFYTLAQNQGVLPISIRSGGKEIANISNLDTTIGSPQTVKWKKGDYSVQAISSSGTNCTWQKTVTVSPGANIQMEYAPCVEGKVLFFTQNPNAASLPIKVYVGINSLIGTITTSSTAPTCDMTGFVNVVLSPGEYTYYAISDSSQCTWSGKFTLTSGACKTIELDLCHH